MEVIDDVGKGLGSDGEGSAGVPHGIDKNGGAEHVVELVETVASGDDSLELDAPGFVLLLVLVADEGRLRRSGEMPSGKSCLRWSCFTKASL